MTAKIELLTPSGGKVILDPTNTAVDRVLTLPATGATLLTDSAGILNIGSGQVVKDANGNVGIGTSSPGAKLEVNGDIRTTAVANRFLMPRGSDSSYSLSMQSLVGGNELQLRNDSGSSGNLVAIGNGVLRFQTENLERMRIDVPGNVGIGTSSPLSRLTVSANGTLGGGEQFNITGANTDIRLRLGIDTSTNKGSIQALIAGVGFQDLLLNPAGGNVGIGTSSPVNKLDVLGDVTVGGFYRNVDVTVVGPAGMLLDLGARSGSTLTSGAAIGAQLDNPATTGVLQLYTRTAGALTEKMRINSAGALLVGKTSASISVTGFVVVGGAVKATSTADAGEFYRKTANAGNGVILTISDVGGTQTVVGAGFANGTFGALSDKRKKKNIVDARNYLDDLMQLRVVKYNWITDAQDAPKELGWIAQEVEQVFPGMITEMQGNKMLKKEVFMPMMLKAIQELSAKVDTQAAEIAALKGETL